MTIQSEFKIDDLNKWILRAFENANVEDSLSNARKAGEALCKIVILKHYEEDRGTRIILGREKLKGGYTRVPELDFNALKDVVVYEQDQDLIIIQSKSERHKIRSYLESIRILGNPAAHDPNSPNELSRPAHARLAQFNLSMLVNWFYKEFLKEPIPEILVDHLNEAEAHHVEAETETESYEDLRGLEIVKICHPKQKNSNVADIKDSFKKISYEFVTTDIGNIKIGYLFVKKKVSITATLQHFIDNLNCQLTSLTICSPRQISPITGKEVTTRLEYIQEKFTELAPPFLAQNVDYFYIDRFMWQVCLKEQTKVLEVDVQSEQYFVDQELFRLQDGRQIDLQFSLEYIKQLINSPEKEKPVNVILGRAGVGKTTFCEQVAELVNKKLDRKKALYISPTDLREVQSDFPVNSITDIYRLYLKAAEADLGEVLDPNSFEINVSCGNIVLIIDGLDEIESFLKDKFDLDSFLASAVYLNQAYKNCSILITSRDYFLDKYLEKDSINIFQLLGFNQEIVDMYLEKRLESDVQKIREAKRYLAKFDITENNRHTPLILSLVCDLIVREEYDHAIPRRDIRESRFFYAEAELDPLIYELLQREIAKQSLDISCDDYYELIEEISVKNHGIITKAALNDYIGIVFYSTAEKTSNVESTKYTQFYNGPLWSHNKESDTFRIKYDFVELWSKVRFILHNFEKENLTDDLIRLLTELYDGTSILLEEIIKMKKITRINYLEHGKHFLKKLVNELKGLEIGNKSRQIQKAISGLLYLVLSEEAVKSRNDYSDALVELYGSEKISYLCIYGNFFPLDLTKIKIYDGWFEQYGNFDKCRFPPDSKVFYYSTFKRIDATISATLNRDLFDSTCSLNDELKSALDHSINSAGKLYEQVRNNLKRIMQVSFHAGGFVLKSEVVHRNAAIKGSASLEQYTKFLLLEGVLDKQIRIGSGTGYLMMVAKDFRDSAKNLIANNIVKPELEAVINKILKKFHNL
jgi:hypothetical protein